MRLWEVGYTYTVGWMALVCFEIVSFGIILSFWTGELDTWAKAVIVTSLVRLPGSFLHPQFPSETPGQLTDMTTPSSSPMPR